MCSTISTSCGSRRFFDVVTQMRSRMFPFSRYIGNVGISGEEELVAASLGSGIGRLTCFERPRPRGDWPELCSAFEDVGWDLACVRSLCDAWVEFPPRVSATVPVTSKAWVKFVSTTAPWEPWVKLGARDCVCWDASVKSGTPWPAISLRGGASRSLLRRLQTPRPLLGCTMGWNPACRDPLFVHHFVIFVAFDGISN